MFNKKEKTMRKTILTFVMAIVVICLSQQVISCNKQSVTTVSENDDKSNRIDYYIDTVVGHVIISTVVSDKSGNIVGVSSIEIKD